MFEWCDNAYNGCISNNWITTYQWTINSRADTRYDFAGSSHAIFPVVFLKSNILITDGIGTVDQPFILSIN